MKRKRLTANQRADLFEAHNGICWRCGLTIDPLREKWHVGHGKKDGGVACGGSDTLENMAPEHKSCNLDHARAVEVPLAAKLKRIRNRRLGTEEPSQMAKQYARVKEKYEYDWSIRRWVPKP